MDRITDRPDMTSAVCRGRKASTQTKTNNKKAHLGPINFVSADKQYFMESINLMLFNFSLDFHMQ